MDSKAAPMDHHKTGSHILQIRKLVHILYFPHLFQEVLGVMTNLAPSVVCNQKSDFLFICLVKIFLICK